MVEQRPFIKATLKTRSWACTDAAFKALPVFHDFCPGDAPSGEPCMCDCHPEPHDQGWPDEVE